MSQQLQIATKFYDKLWPPFFEWDYMCEVEKKILPVSAKSFTFVGSHTQCRSNQHVKKLRFKRCVLLKVPADMTDIFPDLQCLKITKCGLKSISRLELRSMPRLRDLRIEDEPIEHVPGDLLVDLWELKALSLRNNKIRSIGPEIIGDIDRLQFVDLSGNQSISVIYNPTFGLQLSMEKMKIEILTKCAPPVEASAPSLDYLFFDDIREGERHDEVVVQNRASAPVMDQQFFADYRQSADYGVVQRGSGYHEPPPSYEFAVMQKDVR
jgi:hypothetical protein